MCKTWNYYYSCGHPFNFRLSKCRATVFTQSRPGRPHRPACMGGAVLVFKKPFPCGDCAIKDRQDELSEFRSKFETGTEEWMRAEARFEREIFKTEKAFPLYERRKKWKPLEKCGRPPKDLGGSKLKNEVLAEDVKVKLKAEEVDDDWAAYYQEWNCGWITSTEGDVNLQSWETEDVGEPASPSAWDAVASDEICELADDNPWAEAVSTCLSEGCATPNRDDDPFASLFITRSGAKQEAVESPVDDKIQSRAIDAEDAEEQQSEFTDITNNVSTQTSQTALSEEGSKSAVPDHSNINTSTTKSVTPPHLKKQQASFHSRAPDTDYNNTESIDLLEQFKCFQMQTVITVSN